MADFLKMLKRRSTKKTHVAPMSPSKSKDEESGAEVYSYDHKVELLE
jgi:hypothetical protein